MAAAYSVFSDGLELSVLNGVWWGKINIIIFSK